MDDLWAGAWWYLGTTFFRQAMLHWRGEMTPLLHLRLRLDRFEPSQSQDRVLCRNADLRVIQRVAEVDEERRDLFDRHKERFSESIPNALDDFVGPDPSVIPVPAVEFNVFAGDQLVAVSYLAQGQRSVASLYGFFEPSWGQRSLGMFTMLQEIQYAQNTGRELYYPGYALAKPSSMDYKKRFNGLESYEWNQGWKPFPRLTGDTRPAHIPASITVQV
ncbi:MAG TPA: arginine-tRNA-protein transferase [Verrucomicrobiota bacterium]|nr:arginine-tRNA-protein transferase [Verrucomicrobiota bacterium]